jgi:hypothetical protein
MSELSDSAFRMLVTLVYQADENGIISGKLGRVTSRLNRSRSTKARKICELEVENKIINLPDGFLLPELAKAYAQRLPKVKPASPKTVQYCTPEAILPEKACNIATPHPYNNKNKNIYNKYTATQNRSRQDTERNKLTALARSEGSRMRQAVFSNKPEKFEHPLTIQFLEGYGGVVGLRQMRQKDSNFRLSEQQVQMAFRAFSGDDQSTVACAIVEANHIGRAVFSHKPLKSSSPATQAFLGEYQGVEGLRLMARNTVVFLLSVHQFKLHLDNFNSRPLPAPVPKEPSFVSQSPEPEDGYQAGTDRALKKSLHEKAWPEDTLRLDDMSKLRIVYPKSADTFAVYKAWTTLALQKSLPDLSTLISAVTKQAKQSQIISLDKWLLNQCWLEHPPAFEGFKTVRMEANNNFTEPCFRSARGGRNRVSP